MCQILHFNSLKKEKMSNLEKKLKVNSLPSGGIKKHWYEGFSPLKQSQKALLIQYINH